jgi:LysM repeat protein
MGHYFGTNAVGRGVSSFLTNPYLLPVAAGVEGINFMGTEEGESIVNEQKTIDNVIDDNDGSQSLKTWGIYPKYKEGGLLDKYQVKGEIEDAEQFMFDWTNSPMHMNMLKKEDAFNANFIKRARLNNLYTQVGNSHIHDEQPLDRPNLGGTSNSLWADINLYPTRDKLTAVHEYSHASDRNVMPFNYEYVKSPYLKSANDFINPDNSIYDKMASTLLNVGKHIADPFGIAGKFVNDTYHNITGNDIVEGANYLGRRLIPDSSNDMVSNFRFNEDLKSNYSDFRAKELLAKYKKYKDIPYTPDNDFGAESEKEYNEMIEGLKTGAQTSTDWADYVAEPTETRARINSIRKSANDLGIYDVFNEPISKEQFEELLNQESNLTDKPGFNPLGQLQGIFSNDEIFKMLNTFSDASDEINNELSDEVPVEAYAQDGKELNGMEVLTSILPEGKSPEIDAFGYRGYFDFDQAPIQMSDNDDGHLGYLFVYTEGPTAGGSYWRPVNSQYQGGRWEDSGQIEEYEAYFKNSDLIDKHWDKGSAVGNRIREAVENNVLYSELPEYLKDYNTWRTISPDRDLEKELDDLIKEQDGSEITFEDIEKGIRHVESSDGKLMKNRQSSASGFYGQLFNNIDYDGTRDEFIADVEFQKDLFKKRFNGEIEGVPGLKSNGIDIYNEYKDQLDLELTPTQIAALSNLLGRQGTREYIGNVLRDGKTLTEVFPHLYGKDKGAVNKTPSEYIELFNNALLKRKGGEFSKKLSRLKQQLKLYEEGGTISPLAYQELVKLRLIKPEFAGGGSYTVKKGDSLSAIAKANEIKLSELLELNPDYKAKPEFVQIGANIKIPASAASEDESNDNDESITYTVKSGDNLSSIGREKGVSWRDIAKLNDLDDPNSISVNQQLKMPEIPNIVPNNETQKNILEQENNISTSVYSPQGAPDPDAFSTEQSWVDWGMTDNDTYTSVGGKRNKIRDINKMDQADLIVNSVNDNHTDMSDISHTIESGQTLSGISAEYNVPMNRIMEDNNITDPNQINEGSNLKINKSSGDPYIIVDEKSGRMHLYYPGETEPSKSYPILTGANSGDAQTVTQIQYFDPDGNTIDDKEAFEDDMKTLKPGYRSKVNWDWGNKTTGAGVYTIDFANDNSGGYDETGRGRKTPSFVLNNDNNKNVSTAIHVVSNIPGENRVDRLYNRGEFAGDTDNNESNRITNGCINGTCSAMIDLYENPDVKKGTKVFILSDNPEENNFVYENGQVNFRASSDERTDALNYIDEEGTERKGQGINVSTKTLDYKPINFVIDKGAIGNSETFDGSVENEEMEFQTNTVPYIESLSKNKQTLMKDFGINGDRYNDLALIAFGIYGAESKLGDENSAGENAAKYSMAVLNKLGNYVGLDIGGKTGPDVTSEWNYPGITGEDNSVGPTQIVWNQLDPTEKGMLAKLGIESNTDLKDPSNAAQATMVLLNKRLTQTKRIKIKGQEQADGTYTFPEQYDGYLTGSGSDRYLDVQGYRKSSDFDIFSFAPTLWNKADYYPGKVSKYMRFANLQETDIDTVDPEVIVKGEFNQENENFKDLAMEYLTTPNPMPAINSIKEGISGATQVAADAAVNVGNQIVSGVQNATKGVSDWYKTADLNPFWKSGGELFETNAQQRFYEDYISGSYKGTKQSDKAKKLFEKLNRIYYNDSKDKNLHQLDIIKGINQQ